METSEERSVHLQTDGRWRHFWVSLFLNFRTVPGMIVNWLTVPFRYRTLFRGFLNQELRGRYAGSMGGFVWSVLTPLCNLLIYIFVFSVILKIRMKPAETGTDSFVVYLLAGLLPWLAFSDALNNSSAIFVSKASLITKVAFPVELLPLTSVCATFFLNGLGFALFLVFLAFQGYVHFMWLALPIVVGIHLVFTLGLVILVSSMCVFVRDVQHIIGVIVSLWLYLTPILYPISMVPPRYAFLFTLNPMYPIIELYHQVLLQHALAWDLLGLSVLLALSFLAAGTIFFSRARHAFADVL